MKKICFVTAARSEYGLLKWLMNDVANSEVFQLQIIVTGGHLSKAQGHTIDQIVEDGFNVDYIVDSLLDTSSTARIAESMGRMASGFAKAFEELKPDFVLVLGDRYELLPICNTAFVMCIPISVFSYITCRHFPIYNVVVCVSILWNVIIVRITHGTFC